MSRSALSLADFRRMVIKVGSSLLVDSDGGRLHDAWLSSLAEDIAKLHRDKRDGLVVSSGAIALGRAWSEVLGRHGLTAGQVLVTLQDTEERRRYLNARSTIGILLELRSVP